jgi:hypothetical protein
MTDNANKINSIIAYNLDLCQSDSSFNDQFVYDLLMYGFKGLANMTDAELDKELAQCDFDDGNNAENSHYEHISYVDQNGIALDTFGNEYRDEEGMIFIVPADKREDYILLERD